MCLNYITTPAFMYSSKGPGVPSLLLLIFADVPCKIKDLTSSISTVHNVLFWRTQVKAKVTRTRRLEMDNIRACSRTL